MKLSDVRLGRKAERKISVPLPLGDEGEGIEEAPCIAVPLTATEDSEVLVFALEYARGKGAEPREGDPVYDLGCMVKTIELAVKDVDSPREARERFFDRGTDQILSVLSREAIAYVFERCQMWQDDCSPSARRMSVEELVAHITSLAEAEDDGPFVRLRPGLRWICTRIMAKLLRSSAEDKSSPSSWTERVGSVWPEPS